MVRDVYKRAASDGDAVPFSGWVVEYYPRPVRGKGSKRADPGPDDPTVEWSPISWLDGAQGFAKWL